MSNETQRPPDTRPASQKITDLENALMSLYQTADNMARDLGAIKEALKMFNNKLDSVIKASNQGETLTDEVLSRIMLENNVEELANKTKIMQAQGIIVPSVQVADDSFLVGSEENFDGVVTNPRIQFAIYAVQPPLQEKLKGLLVGDKIVLREGELKLKVLEIYQIQPQKQPEAPPAAEAAPAAPAEAAPEQSTQEAPAAPAEQPATPAV